MKRARNDGEASEIIVQKAYTVLVYTDYRKGNGQRVIRSYADKDQAIAFAKSLSTDYLASQTSTEKDQTELYEDDVYTNREVEYCEIVGNIFDAQLAPTVNVILEEDFKDLKGSFINRIAVDESDFYN